MMTLHTLDLKLYTAREPDLHDQSTWDGVKKTM